MRPLETEDAGWVDDLANLLGEVTSLAEHLDRELVNLDDRYGRRRPDKYYGSDPSYGSSASSWAASAYNSDPYGPNYRGAPESRYSHYVREASDRAAHYLKVYKEKMR